MSTQPKPFLTPEQYLAIERAAECKSEYYRGEMFAMSGVSLRHNRIASQLHFLLKQHLQRKGCDVNTSDLRVNVPATGLYTYPHLSVVCGEPDLADSYVDTLLNPSLLVEILSPSTERYDRAFKIHAYRTIPSVRECLLVAQDQHLVELHRRMPDGSWSVFESRGREATLELTSINYTLRLDELYETALPPD
jgi:Uma2 family endonuclease